MTTENTEVAVQEAFALPVDPDKVDMDVLKAAMGASDDPMSGSIIPRLSINYDGEWVDEDAQAAAKEAGKKYKPISLPLSHYKVSVQTETDEEGELTGPYTTVFAETAIFRPIITANRYQIYDLEEEKMSLSTEIYRTWQQVIVDDLGGEQSAKSYKKKMLQKYSHLVKGEDRNLKCKNVLFGVLTLVDGVDKDGNEVEVKDVPCEWYSHGASFMPVADALGELKKRGLLPCQRAMHLDTGREKNGQVTFYPVEVEWGAEEFELDVNTLELTRDFSALIDAENEEIRAKYTARHAKNQADEISTVIENESLGDDLDDKIPF